MNDENALTVAEPQAVVWLVQEPTFGERLSALKAEWDAAADKAEALEVSDENLQAVKKERAALTKAFKEVEEQRKNALAPVREKIDAFNDIYGECVTNAYRRADAALKGKIDAIESGLKNACEQRLRDYWRELCAVRNIDFVPFERTGVKVDLTSARQKTPKKLMEQLTAFADGVSNAAAAITDPEVMAEYKASLDLGAAIAVVNERCRRIEAERQDAARRREAEALAAQAAAKVEAAAPEVLAPPVAVPVAPEAPAPTPAKQSAFPPVFAFKIYFGAAEQWEAIKPLLIGLRDALKENNVRYE